MWAKISGCVHLMPNIHRTLHMETIQTQSPSLLIDLSLVEIAPIANSIQEEIFQSKQATKTPTSMLAEHFPGQKLIKLDVPSSFHF